MVQPAQHRHAGGQRRSAGACLVAKQRELLDLRTDEDQPGVSALARKVVALGQETVARVDRVAATGQRRGDQRVGVEVSRCTLARQCAGLVGPTPVQAAGVILRVGRDAAKSQVGDGASDAYRHLAAVGDEDLGDGHRRVLGGLGLVMLAVWRSISAHRRGCAEAATAQCGQDLLGGEFISAVLPAWAGRARRSATW